MIDYIKFDLMRLDDIIATVDLKPANGSSPFLINYIDDFNRQFSPNMEDHITLEELEC